MTLTASQRVALRRLGGLFREAAWGDPITDADLERAGVPESYRTTLKRELGEIAEIANAGDRADARRRADDALALSVEALDGQMQVVEPGASGGAGDPRELAKHAAGEPSAADAEDDPRVLARDLRTF